MPSEYAASLTRRFQDACRAFEDRERRRLLAEAAVGRLETLATELEQLAASEQPVDEVVARWRGLRRDADVLREHASANLVAAERLERAVAVLEEKENEYQQARAKLEQENLRRLQQFCRQVEALAAAEQLTLKAGDRALREIRAALEDRAPLPSKQDRQEIQTRLEDARAKLAPRIQELRDADEWQRWANLQVQEEICREDGDAQDRGEPRGRRSADARAAGAMEAGCAGATSAGRGDVAAFQDGAGRGVRANVRVLRGAERGARRQPRSQAGAVRARRGTGRVDRLGEDGRRDPGAAGGVEDDRTGGSRPREGDLGAIPRRLRSVLHPPSGRSQASQGRVGRQPGAQGSAVRCGRGAGRVDRVGQPPRRSCKQLQAEWKTIGPVRKSKSEAIWQRFRAACDGSSIATSIAIRSNCRRRPRLAKR